MRARAVVLLCTLLLSCSKDHSSSVDADGSPTREIGVSGESRAGDTYSAGDTDGDGLLDEDEALFHTDPSQRDTDNDGIGDLAEARSQPATGTVVIVRSADGERPFFPSVARLPSGELVVAFYWNKVHVGDLTKGEFGTFRLTRSRDNGRTWSAPVTMLDWSKKSLELRDPSLLALADGRLALTFFTRCNATASATTGVPCGGYFAASSDAGATFTDPAPLPLPSELAWSAMSAPVVELDDRTLLAALYGAGTGTSSQVRVVRSSDGGRTWGGATVVALDEQHNLAYQEPALVSLGKGRVWCLTRATSRLFESTDGGKTWEQLADPGLVMHAPDWLPLGPDQLLATWCRGPDSGPYGSRRPVEAKIVHPSLGWNRSPFHVLYDPGAGGSDMGYPSSVLTAEGLILTVYYDNYRGLVEGRLSRPEEWDAPTAEGERLDLLSLAKSSQLDVQSDLTWTDPSYPETGVLAALDGMLDHWHQARKPSAALPGVFTLSLPAPASLSSVGACLSPDFRESANLLLSADGTTWGAPASRFAQQDCATVEHAALTALPRVRAVRLQIDEASGRRPVLTELTLHRADTFEEDSTGQPPAGYSGLLDEIAVATAPGGRSGRALRVHDTSSQSLARVVKVTTPARAKLFQFEIFPVAAPQGDTMGILSGGDDNEHAAYHLRVDAQGNLSWYDGSTWVSMAAGAVPLGRWSTIRVEADLASARVLVNGQEVGYAHAWHAFSSLDRARFMSGQTSGTGDDFYVDNVLFD